MPEICISRTSISAQHVTAIRHIDNNHIAFGDQDGGIKVINLETGESVYWLTEKYPIDDLVILNNDVIGLIFTGSKYTYIKLWKYKKNKNAKLLHKSSYRSDGMCEVIGDHGQYLAIFSDFFQ